MVKKNLTNLIEDIFKAYDFNNAMKLVAESEANEYKKCPYICINHEEVFATPENIPHDIVEKYYSPKEYVENILYYICEIVDDNVYYIKNFFIEVLTEYISENFTEYLDDFTTAVVKEFTK